MKVTRKSSCPPPATIATSNSVNVALIYDNGPYVTHPGGGPNGTNASILQNSTLGMTVLGFSFATTFRLADDFTIAAPGGWRIDSITVNGYLTGADTTVPPSATALNFRIWNGVPDAPGSSVVFGDTTTNRLTSSRWQREVRYTQTASGITRALKIVNASAGVTLPPGTYWLDWNNAGLNFAPPITITGDSVTGNAFQRGTTGWANLLDGTKPQGMPFLLHGEVLAVADTVLVILQDTTVASVKRHADHDTLFTYLSSLVPTYQKVYIDTAGATLPSLTNYKKILYVETSFDNAGTRWLGANSRQALKNWLNSGTPGDKKSLVMVGGDLAYNLSRPTSGGRDTVLAKDMLKFTYRVDNGNVTGQNSITGVNINNGGILTLNTAPAGGGFYPDGCFPDAAGSVLYRYTGRGASDTVASVGYAASGYTAATLFADPRYFTVSGPNTGFGQALRDMLAFSGAITEVPSQSIELPNEYTLSQNYPNPFNPTTTIQFGLPVAANVTVKIYNLLGQEVATLVDDFRGAGTFQTVWGGRNSAGAPVASGMYFYSLVAKSADSKATYTSIKKMLLLK